MRRDGRGGGRGVRPMSGADSAGDERRRKRDVVRPNACSHGWCGGAVAPAVVVVPASAGFGPDALRLVKRLSTSNQNGAPSETAKVVTRRPATFVAQSNGSTGGTVH